MKYCTKCKKLKDESEFSKNRVRKDGLSYWCKECVSQYTRMRYLTNPKPSKIYLRYEENHRTIDGVKQKRCTKCKKLKYESEFQKNRVRMDGLRYWCKECRYEYARMLYLRNTKPSRRNLRYEEIHRTIGGVKQKRCTKCKEWKQESEFVKYCRSRDGLYSWCKICMRKHGWKQYRKKGKPVKR